MALLFVLANHWREASCRPMMRQAKAAAFVMHSARTSLPRSFLSRKDTSASVPRQFSSSNAASLDQQADVELIHPSQLFNGTIPYPKSLSPSAVMEFKKCPQSYLFQYLYGLRQPTNTALALGSMCHEALEKLFDLDPADRTLEHLQNLFRASWGKHRLSKTYRDLFGTDPQHDGEWDKAAEQQWGQQGLKLLENYYHVEDPRLVARPNPIQREIWLRADLTVDPSKGVTGHDHERASSSDHAVDTFHVRGIVDRLDMVRISSHEVALRIVDYKTGKAPNFKYSRAMNEQIAQESFYQLKIYALLLREKGNSYANGLDLRMLRLLYLTSESGAGQYLDMDLGATQEERDAVLQEIHADLANVWTSINELVATQDPHAFVGCDRSFCYCHKCRRQFVPGTVWDG